MILTDWEFPQFQNFQYLRHYIYLISSFISFEFSQSMAQLFTYLYKTSSHKGVEI